MVNTGSQKSNNIPKQNESLKGATSPHSIWTFSSTNKDMQNIEKAAELTATFLVPFVLAIVLFIFIAVFNASSEAEMGYWSTLLNNLFFISLIISVMLTWLLLVIYYLIGSSPVRLLKGSIFFSGISIILAAILIFFPQQIFPTLINYSNFFHTKQAIVLSFVFVAGVITYWCFCIRAFSHINNISNHKSDLSDKQLTNVTESKYSRGSGL